MIYIKGAIVLVQTYITVRVGVIPDEVKYDCISALLHPCLQHPTYSASIMEVDLDTGLTFNLVAD